MSEQEYPTPKDWLAEIFEKDEEKFFADCYEVHKEYEIKAGRIPQSIEEYKKWFYRVRTEEELKEQEEEQDKWDTYLRHNGPMGSRKRN